MKLLTYFFTFLAFLVSVSSTQLMAADTTLNVTMSKIGGIMARNYPLLVFPREMSDPQLVAMEADLRKLQGLFRTVEPYIRSKSDAYQLTLGIVRENIDQAIEAMENRQYGLARNRFRVTGSLCSNCHTQDNRLRTLFQGRQRAAFPDDLSYAEFNFSTRNYAEAEVYFDKYLRSDLVRYDSDIQLPLRRLLTIYTQVLNTPGEGVKQLESYLKLPRHSELSRKYLQDIIEAMGQLNTTVNKELTSIKFSQLEQYVMDILGGYFTPSPVMFSSPKQEVERVWLRGLLYRYLNEMAEVQEIPSILYWLSLCERALGYNYDFSVSDYYLKACIKRYPYAPFARSCYDEYESYLRFFHTSPIDPIFPREVAEELAGLKKVLQKQKYPNGKYLHVF